MGMVVLCGAQDDEGALPALGRALDLGVTHYDESNVYGRGANEQLLGRFGKGKRDQLTICTKFGVVRDPDGPQGSNYDRGIDNSPAHLRRSCEESLARLAVDAIDLCYVHRIDPAVPTEEHMGTRGQLVQRGKIRATGRPRPASGRGGRERGRR